MQFQHLIEINDLRHPLIPTLTRDQLWRGLVMRAEAPKLFIPWLDECDLLGRKDNVLTRELRYNALLIRDHVTFTPQEKVHYDVPAQEDIPASSLLMTIEEPQPGLCALHMTAVCLTTTWMRFITSSVVRHTRNRISRRYASSVNWLKKAGWNCRSDAPSVQAIQEYF
jgi:hypothetical protein